MDENQITASVVARATHEKNPAAVELGRRGGLRGGKARAAKLSPANENLEPTQIDVKEALHIQRSLLDSE